MEVDTATVAKSRAGKARTARSEWQHSQVFSSDEEADEGGAAKGGRNRASLWGDSPGKAGPKSMKSHVTSRKVLTCQVSSTALHRFLVPMKY